MKYRAFLSYSHADRKQVRWLHRALESYRPPRNLVTPDGRNAPRNLSPIFRDREELASTSSLSDAVDEALAESETLIVVCSPQSASSRWVNEEIRSFRALGRSANILCFVIDGEPGSGAEDECFPSALTAPEEAGGAPLEPVAADARPGGDGRENAKLKIAAGMLGVGFDALKQRDLRRRQQRMVATTSGSLIIATLTILLAINASIARNEAELRRRQAEDLIDFMLGDLHEQLRSIGRLDLFLSVGDKAADYFAAQREGNDTEDTLSQRARNLRQIGEIQLEQGHMESALQVLNESLQIIERLAQRAPDKAETQIGLANSLFYIGYTHWQRGEMNQARQFFERIIPIVDTVSAREPHKPAWAIEKAYAYTNLGRVLEQEGALEEALAAYRAVMEVNHHLVELEPENPEWQLELGFAHNNMGKLYAALGRLDEAESNYRRDLEIKNRIHSANTSHNANRSYLAVSQYHLGRLLILRGVLAEGEVLLNDALEHFTLLNEVVPDHPAWLARRARIEQALGIAHGYSGDVLEGIEHLNSSLRILQGLLQQEEGKASWRRDLTRSLLLSVDIGIRRREYVGATRNLETAETLIGEFLEQETTNLETWELVVFSHICAAHLAMESDPVAAKIRLETALRLLAEHFANSVAPQILELRTEALAALDRNEEAAALRRQLQAIGYRGRGNKSGELL